MSKEYRTKVFKSGNSVAIRMPKAWGFQPGEEIEILPLQDGGYEVRRPAENTLSLDELFGSFSPDFMARGRGATEQDERDWHGPDQPHRAA